MPMGPVGALAGTVTVISVSFSTLKAALVPPIVAAVVPRKLAPMTVTTVPGRPVCGEKLLMTGTAAFSSQLRTMAPVAASAGLVELELYPSTAMS